MASYFSLSPARGISQLAKESGGEISPGKCPSMTFVRVSYLPNYLPYGVSTLAIVEMQIEASRSSYQQSCHSFLMSCTPPKHA